MLEGLEKVDPSIVDRIICVLTKCDLVNEAEHITNIFDRVNGVSDDRPAVLKNFVAVKNRSNIPQHKDALMTLEQAAATEKSWFMQQTDLRSLCPDKQVTSQALVNKLDKLLFQHIVVNWLPSVLTKLDKYIQSILGQLEALGKANVKGRQILEYFIEMVTSKQHTLEMYCIAVCQELAWPNVDGTLKENENNRKKLLAEARNLPNALKDKVASTLTTILNDGSLPWKINRFEGLQCALQDHLSQNVETRSCIFHEMCDQIVNMYAWGSFDPKGGSKAMSAALYSSLLADYVDELQNHEVMSKLLADSSIWQENQDHEAKRAKLEEELKKAKMAHDMVCAMIVLSRLVVKFSEKEIQGAFKFFDCDGDGNVSAEEIGAVLKKMNTHLTEEHIAGLISDHDVDGDGQLNFEEFSKMMHTADVLM